MSSFEQAKLAAEVLANEESDVPKAMCPRCRSEGAVYNERTRTLSCKKCRYSHKVEGPAQPTQKRRKPT